MQKYFRESKRCYFPSFDGPQMSSHLDDWELIKCAEIGTLILCNFHHMNKFPRGSKAGYTPDKQITPKKRHTA